ncbi:hypothetical protein ACFPVT_04990 [Corynebacterium choanae]|uniref:Gram-positive cocci surface proteins LPxTG domain-containing protein n=1 Tax=Corynebacterium choanae TaxID=1862358 RepID=A0A3G6JEJ0_9CORY|nr:hypothetical protein [Corynebacterium choanae]AZA14564.1 hypothetical protein CCHOA_10930 [Corynebacterium choanae]
MQKRLVARRWATVMTAVFLGVSATFFPVGTQLPQAQAIAITGDVTGLNPADIDLNRTVTLTVNKDAGNPFDEPAEDMEPHTNVGRELLLVEFSGFNVSDPADYERAKQLTTLDAQDLPIANTYKQRTDAQGQAVFGGLRPGVYLLGEEVRETEKASYHTVPSLLILPVGAEGKAWVYNVSIDAKDELTKPKPEVPTPPTTVKPKPGEELEPGSSAEIGLGLIPLIIGGFLLGSASSQVPEPPMPPVQPSPTESPAPTTTPTPAKQQPTKGIPKLARTGANVDAIALLAVLLVVLGGGAVVASRKRAS